MSVNNPGLITETNRQYYEGAQSFYESGTGGRYLTTFNTDLIYKSSDPNTDAYELNNFKVYTSATGLPGSFAEMGINWRAEGNLIIFDTTPAPTVTIVVQLKRLEGGKYGDKNAYGTVVEENYGGYVYNTLLDIINNFMVGYVGDGKLIPNIKRTDVIFHAKRAMQEFSYDTLKSIKSQELSIPPSLNVVLPQDYVNYVKISRIDQNGIKHPIYPNLLSASPYTIPIQDTEGFPIQDTFDSNINGDSLTEERWATNTVTESQARSRSVELNFGSQYAVTAGLFGQRYGLDPVNSNYNGTFIMNEREGKISFSSDLVGCLIVLEYISDGLAYDLDTRVPKLAEEAMYACILHSIISLRSNQPEYLVQRLKQEKFAKLRNAKIRLSNIKLEEFTKLLRGQYKWIKQ